MKGNEAALLLSLIGGSSIRVEASNHQKRLMAEKERRENPHNYPLFIFEHEGRPFKIYAYNQAAADEKWAAIKKKL